MVWGRGDAAGRICITTHGSEADHVVADRISILNINNLERGSLDKDNLGAVIGPFERKYRWGKGGTGRGKSHGQPVPHAQPKTTGAKGKVVYFK